MTIMRTAAHISALHFALCSTEILIVKIRTEIKIVKLNSALFVIPSYILHNIDLVVMMMMIVMVFDSGAGLRLMGGDGDISSSLYPGQ